MSKAIHFDSESSGQQEGQIYGERKYKGGRGGSGKVQNRNKWTPSQNEKYCFFLHSNLHILSCDLLRKKTRIFSLMSGYISTRSTPQVKSHHQKMMKRHKEIKHIIRHMERKLNISIVVDLPPPKETREVQLQTESQFLTPQNISEPRNQGTAVDQMERMIPRQEYQGFFDQSAWLNDI